MEIRALLYKSVLNRSLLAASMVAVLAALFVAGPARAARFSFGISVGVPVYCPAPVFYTPVYVQPVAQPVYTAPAPVYTAPQPVYTQQAPQPAYSPPVAPVTQPVYTQPAYVQPQPVYVPPPVYYYSPPVYYNPYCYQPYFDRPFCGPGIRFGFGFGGYRRFDFDRR